MKLLQISTLAFLTLSISARAEMFGKDDQPCGDQPATFAIVECTAARTKVWDQRLNAAYKALGQVIDPAQREPLKAAQRFEFNIATPTADSTARTKARSARCWPPIASGQ